MRSVNQQSRLRHPRLRRLGGQRMYLKGTKEIWGCGEEGNIHIGTIKANYPASRDTTQDTNTILLVARLLSAEGVKEVELNKL